MSADPKHVEFVQALHRLCVEHGVLDPSACSCCAGVNVEFADGSAGVGVEFADGDFIFAVEVRPDVTASHPAVEKLERIRMLYADDREVMHAEADKVLLECVPQPVADAFRSLGALWYS